MPEPALLALYVRDLAGVGPYVLPDLPPLVPAVEPTADSVDRRLAIREWERWWASKDVQLPDLLPMLAPPEWHGLEDAPTLRALLARQFDDAQSRVLSARTAAARRQNRMHLTHFVNGYERLLGRPVRPFRLWLGEVPVQGAAGWAVAEAHMLVSSELMSDEAGLEAFLEPLMHELA